MATLTSTKIKNTYDALLKASDNDAIGSSAKQITDGLGNGTPLYISTTQIGIGVTPEATYDLHVYSNAKVGGNLTVTGDLTVEGTTTTIDTQTLTVEDPLIEVASNNTSTDAVDIGWYGKYAPSGTTLYAGLFRDTGDSKFKLFRNLEEQPTTTVNTSGTGYTKASLVIGNLEATGADFTGQVSLPDGSVANPALNFTSDADTGISYDLALKLVFAGAEAVKITTPSVDIKPNGTSVLRVDTTGVNFFQDAIFGNDIKARFGGSGDLQIYHSATGDSYIANNTGNLIINSSGITGTAIKDEDNMASDSASHLATQQSIKAYVDTSVGNSTLAEVLVNGNTTGGTDLIVSTSDQIFLPNGSETNPALTFTNDSDTGIFLSGVSLNMSTAGEERVSISNNFISFKPDGFTRFSVDYNGIFAYLDTEIQGELTVTGTGQSSFAGQVTIPATPSASTDAASKGYVDSQVGANNELSEVLANGNTTGGTDIVITAGDKITNFTSTGIDDNATSTALTIDSSQNATFAGNVTLSQNGTNFEHVNAGNGLVLSHYNVGGSNAIVSGGASNPDTLFINNGGANDWSNVSITGNVGIGTDSQPSPNMNL